MGAHGLSRRVGVPLLDGRQNALVMVLPALRTSLNIKNAAALFA
jgi:hypothetical protein